MTTPSGRRRVAIVDDNELTRAGCQRLLGADPAIEVVASVGHDVALGWTDEWSRVDVLVVDAADERREDDQFPGVAVVERLRAAAGSAVTVVVLTGHYLDDAVRWRMREAGADFFYARTHAMTGEQLVEVVLRPDGARRVPPPADPDAVAGLGVTPSSQVNAFVAAAREAGEGALAPGGRPPTSVTARSRWWHRLRRRVAEAGRIIPVNTDGSAPRRDQDVPSLGQLRRVYEWATRVKPPPPS